MADPSGSSSSSSAARAWNSRLYSTTGGQTAATRGSELAVAQAVTIHKSQGSEYRAVVIPVMTQRYAMLQRNLIYTGVTRGKKLVVLVGQKRTVAVAVKNVSGRRRWSKLDEWLSVSTRAHRPVQ